MTEWGVPRELRAAYEDCRRVAAEHGRTYFLATSLLPGPRRPHVWALYAFARVSDDLVDNPVEDPAVALPAWRDQALEAVGRQTGPPAGGPPLLAALHHSMRVIGWETSQLERFLDSMVMDLTVNSYATWDDLRGYMAGSAAVIGEMMAPLLGAGEPSALPRAAALGEAFQLTNFIRDVAEDRRRGRTYLPLEDLTRHGVTVADLDRCTERGAITPAVRRVVQDEVARAHGLYEQARPGLAQVDRRSRACLRVAFELYRGILDEVVRARYDVFAGRARVPGWRRAAVLLNATAPHQR